MSVPPPATAAPAPLPHTITLVDDRDILRYHSSFHETVAYGDTLGAPVDLVKHTYESAINVPSVEHQTWKHGFTFGRDNAMDSPLVRARAEAVADAARAAGIVSLLNHHVGFHPNGTVSWTYADGREETYVEGRPLPPQINRVRIAANDLTKALLKNWVTGD